MCHCHLGLDKPQHSAVLSVQYSRLGQPKLSALSNVLRGRALPSGEPLLEITVSHKNTVGDSGPTVMTTGFILDSDPDHSLVQVLTRY